MIIPDPQESRAVLIGSSNYESLPDLPSVRNNVVDLQRCFCDHRIWGLPAQNCAVVSDPGSSAELMTPIDDAAATAYDTLLLYFAGHGLVDPDDGTLSLAVATSKSGKSYTSSPYDQIRRLLVDSPAKRRIVILDCCYSGRAVGGMSDSASTSAAIEQTSAEGVFVLTATPENREALAPPGEKYTAFTGELIRLLRNGIQGESEVLTLDSIYAGLRESLRARGRPLPQKRVRNTAGDLPLVFNAYQAIQPVVPIIELITRQRKCENTYRVLFGEKVSSRRGKRFPRRALGYSPNQVDDALEAASRHAQHLLELVNPTLLRGGTSNSRWVQRPPLTGGGFLPGGTPIPSVYHHPRELLSSFKNPHVRRDFSNTAGGYDRSSVKIWQEACKIYAEQIWEIDEQMRSG